jgi:hypothetical protein
MGIKEIFHKIKAGFTRCFGTPVPRVSDAKRYGDSGEDDFVSELRQWLPSCKIKRNIMILTPDGNAEIDCLVLYDNKLFGMPAKNKKLEGQTYRTEKRICTRKNRQVDGRNP